MNRIRTLATVAFALSACAPDLDWRDRRIDGTPIHVSFPCRPASHARGVALADRPLQMTLYACTVGGSTFGLMWADVGDPAQVGASLQRLAASTAANVSGTLQAAAPLAVAGATPNPSSGHWALAGRLPDGNAVSGRVAVFAVGTQVFQATVIGAPSRLEAAATFIESLQVRP